MRAKYVFWPPLFAALLVFVHGCTAVALVGAGAGTAIYVTGDLETVVAKDINTVYQATLKAIEQLDLKAGTKTKDALAAKIIARDAQDKKITIKLKSKSENATELNIRVGVFGDETKSRLIYEQIKKNLK